MLVQMSFSEVLGRTQSYQGHALCTKCGKTVGPLSLDELQAMMSGKYGDVLCFDCEDFPPQPFGLANAKTIKTLLTLFNLTNPTDLPINSWPYWSNDRFDVALQMTKNFGWCFWQLTPDDRAWKLSRVKMHYTEAVVYKDAFLMVPVNV
jgi:hypothetical protein